MYSHSIFHWEFLIWFHVLSVSQYFEVAEEQHQSAEDVVIAAPAVEVEAAQVESANLQVQM
jgi:hypothetical protein